jgi:hypothetical protein
MQDTSHFSWFLIENKLWIYVFLIYTLCFLEKLIYRINLEVTLIVTKIWESRFIFNWSTQGATFELEPALVVTDIGVILTGGRS